MPQWPIERWRRAVAPAEAPPTTVAFALTDPIASALRLSAVNPAALALGLRVGMPLADARARAPGLVCAPRDHPAERAALEALARWCVRFSPRTTPVLDAFSEDIAAGCGLYLDVTGVTHLFGGEADWLAAVLARLRALGLSAQGALADTAGLAAALAGFDRRALSGFVCPPGAGLAAIAHLPTACLRIAAKTRADLRAVGLKRVGEVQAVARASLARRFGETLVERLDQAAGEVAEAADPIAPATRVFALRRLLTPIVTTAAVALVARDLSVVVAGKLDRLGCGARSVRLDLCGVDGQARAIAVGFASPQADAVQLARVLVERAERTLETLDLGLGVEAVALVVTALARTQAHAIDLDPHAARRAHAAASLTTLADALRARLGADAVCFTQNRDSAIPERAQKRAVDARAAAAEPAPARADRPLFLLARPEPIETMAEAPDGPPRSFRWRRRMFKVSRSEGPERISDEWWRVQAPTRDYFRIETEEGRRLWLCREGLYGRETDRARWFVHGSFA